MGAGAKEAGAGGAGAGAKEAGAGEAGTGAKAVGARGAGAKAVGAGGAGATAVGAGGAGAKAVGAGGARTKAVGASGAGAKAVGAGGAAADVIIGEGVLEAGPNAGPKTANAPGCNNIVWLLPDAGGAAAVGWGGAPAAVPPEFISPESLPSFSVRLILMLLKFWLSTMMGDRYQ